MEFLSNFKMSSPPT